MLKFLIALMIFGMPLTVGAQSKNISIDGDHGKLAVVLQTPDGQKKFPLRFLETEFL